MVLAEKSAKDIPREKIMLDYTPFGAGGGGKLYPFEGAADRCAGYPDA